MTVIIQGDYTPDNSQGNVQTLHALSEKPATVDEFGQKQKKSERSGSSALSFHPFLPGDTRDFNYPNL